MTALGLREAPSGLVDGPRGQQGWGKAVIYVVLVLLAVVWLVPIAWALATSFKPDAETTVAPVSWLASKESLDAYRTILDQGNILKWYFNSIVTASMITGGHDPHREPGRVRVLAHALRGARRDACGCCSQG